LPCYHVDTGVTSMFRLIRRVVTLVRMFPTLYLSWEYLENIVTQTEQVLVVLRVMNSSDPHTEGWLGRLMILLQ